MKKEAQYHWKKVVFLVTFSSFCVSIVGGAICFFYRLYLTNSQAVIQTIVQTSTGYSALQTAYLAEVLELSKDEPISLSRFDLEEAHGRLMTTHVIKEAYLKKIKPNCLYIEYKMREPIALLNDYTNTALDLEGMLYPYLPFYSPKCLPKIHLGEEAPPNPWGKKIIPKQISLIKEILTRFDIGEIQRIDLSESEVSSPGRRQVVLVLKCGTILRLTPENYHQKITYYFILSKQIKEKMHVIDLRNPNVAYISYGK